MADKCSSEMAECEGKPIIWELNKWNTNYKQLVAANASSCVVEVGNPKVALRYFLRPSLPTNPRSGLPNDSMNFSLCVDLLEVTSNCVLTANTSLSALSDANVGVININRNNKGQKLVLLEKFLLWNKSDTIYSPRHTANQQTPMYTFWNQPNLAIEIITTISELHQKNGENEDTYSAIEDYPCAAAQTNALITDLKAALANEKNYSDIKLETKDNITLSAHKFFLVSRSPVFQKMVEEAVEKEDYDGTLKIDDVNAKAMMVILHWMYTGELHENAARVMEEVVEASIKYKLNDLLKILDKQLITICNEDNMFQLIQVARKYAMATAVEKISAYIKENL